MTGVNEILRIAKDKAIQQEEDEILLQPFTYVRKIPSKQNRSKLCKAFNHWLNIPPEKLELICEIIEILHNSSLLMDDIEDNSTLRRGMKVAHSVYGLSCTLNSACYSMFTAQGKLSLLNHPEAINVFIEQMLEAHRGQGMEIHWRDTCTVPTESDYKQMAIRKKGALIILTLKLMQLFSTNKKDFSELIVILGLYLQILDDYSNMTTNDNNGNKTFCEDLTEGKFSFPIIHAIRNGKYKSEVLSIMRQRTSDVELKKYFISLLEKSGSLKYTRDMLDALDRKARDEVDKLGPNPYMESILNELSSWKVNTK